MKLEFSKHVGLRGQLICYDAAEMSHYYSFCKKLPAAFREPEAGQRMGPLV